MTTNRIETVSRRRLLAGGGAVLAAGALPARALADPAPDPASVVEAMVRDQAFQGVVMLGRRGRPRFVRATGLADIEADVPMRPDTVLGIASISKRLTTVAVMRLVDQGRLSLDAPITTWLPDYRADTGARITLRRLLSNTSGVPNLFMEALRADASLMTAPFTTAEAVRRFGEGDLAFEPGTRFDYVLTNWMIVLAILEAVTGQAYPDAMRTLVLDPFGMADTRLDPAMAARGYRSVSPLVLATNVRQPYHAAAGGYYSTAADLLRFSHRVYDTGFLSAASRRALVTLEAVDDHYALGGRVRWVKIDGADVACAWETGNTAGFRSVLGHRLDGRGSVVILNNASLSQRTMDEFADALLRCRT